MKYKWFYIWILLCTVSIVHADIDAQIDAIKNASIEERFKLMNAFKRNLLQMKEEERLKAIKKLSKESNKTNAKKALEEMKENSTHTHIQDSLDYHHIDDDNLITEASEEEGEEHDD